MVVEKKSKVEYSTTNWAGGLTTEILINPLTSSLKQRDFDFRISTATVTASKSIFSNFIGYERIIMSLDAPISLQQKNIITPLRPFEVYRFDGQHEVKSLGQCQDFNVIFKKNCDVWIDVMKNRDIKSLFNNGINILYTLQAVIVKLIVPDRTEKILLQEGETLILNKESFEQLQVIKQKESVMKEKIAILTQIKDKTE